MNEVSSSSTPWTPRRWWYTIGLVFLAHVALVFLLGDPPRRPVALAPFRTTIYLAMDAQSFHRVAELPTLADPTVFALPSHHGFSGEAWLKFNPLPPQWTEWTEPPRWLALEEGMMGQTHSEPLATNLSKPLMVAAKPLPPLIRSTPNIGLWPVSERSELRIEGELARRPLLLSLDLPSWPHTDILTNSVVQMVVDAEGQPVSAVLLATSGSIEADQRSLALSRSVRFQPLPRRPAPESEAARLTWGRLIFKWHTAIPTVTNLPAAKP